MIVEGRDTFRASMSAGFARRDEGAHRQAHEIVDARADDDLLRAAAMLLRERVAQVERFRIAVP